MWGLVSAQHFARPDIRCVTLSGHADHASCTSDRIQTTEPQDTAQRVTIEESTSAPAQGSGSGNIRPTGLRKCPQCHMACLSATGLLQHVQDCHDPTVHDPDLAPIAQDSKRLKTSRTVQQIFNLPISGPQPEAPRQFECPICLEIVGRKALIGHLRREHQAVHTGAFAFVPE